MGAKVDDLCRRHGISGTRLYKWKAKLGGMDVSEAKKLTALEDVNRRLKKLLTEQMFQAGAQRAPNSSHDPAGRAPRQWRIS